MYNLKIPDTGYTKDVFKFYYEDPSVKIFLLSSMFIYPNSYLSISHSQNIISLCCLNNFLVNHLVLAFITISKVDLEVRVCEKDCS